MNKIRPFAFAEFRFAIATILLLAAGFKAYQLATSPLPPVVQGSFFTPLLYLLNNRWLLIIVVELEILFSLFLIAGLWRRWTWLASILCFSGFALVSALKGLSGESSCGCFGAVPVNPWITTIFDGTVVGLLLLFQPEKNVEVAIGPKTPAISAWSVVLSWLMIALPLGWLMASFQPSVVASSGEIVGQSNVVMLYPEEWLDQKWPLLEFVEIEEDLSQGRWVVVLYGADCSKCRTHFEEWKNGGFPVDANGDERVAMLEISGQSENRIKDRLAGEPYAWGHLNGDKRWFVETPVVLLLQEGGIRRVWMENR